MQYLPAPDESLWIGVLRVAIQISGARSLKDRRQIVSSLRDRTQTKFRASFADIGHLDAPSMAVIAVSVVGNDSRLLQARLDSIFADMESVADAVIVSRATEVFPIKPTF